MGGESDYTLNRVVEYCDGWIPRASPSFDPVEGMTRMHQAAEKVGRDPATLSMSVFRAPPEKQKLQAYAVVGVQRRPIIRRGDRLLLLEGPKPKYGLFTT